MFERRTYLLDVTDRCPNRRTMQELVDVLARFGYTEFCLYDTAKEREAPLETAKTEAYCRMQGIGFKVVGEDFRREIEADAKTVGRWSRRLLPRVRSAGASRKCARRWNAPRPRAPSERQRVLS